MTGKGFLLPVVALAAFAAGYAAATVARVADAEEIRRAVAAEYEAKVDRLRARHAEHQRAMRDFSDSRLRQARQTSIQLAKRLVEKEAEIQRLKRSP